ncbi:MAG: peptidoglycan editing factor PgeF [Thermodesulfobacteriota bacterium]
MLEQREGIKFFTSGLLAEGRGVTHAFLTRAGGSSPAPFDTMNLGADCGDDPVNVAANAKRLSEVFGFRPERLTTAKQVHGFMMVTVRDRGGAVYSGIESDALATPTPGVPVGVLTADCVPLLIHAPAAGAVAAVHAGWKGAAAGIARRSVNVMAGKFSTSPGEMVAAIGPRIGPCCYTVGAEVPDAFREDFGEGLEYFSEKDDGTFTLDLGEATRAQLIEAGMTEANIEVIDACTACDPDLFFSYRRDGERTGRQLSFIMVEG